MRILMPTTHRQPTTAAAQLCALTPRKVTRREEPLSRMQRKWASVTKSLNDSKGRGGKLREVSPISSAGLRRWHQATRQHYHQASCCGTGCCESAIVRVLPTESTKGKSILVPVSTSISKFNSFGGYSKYCGDRTTSRPTSKRTVSHQF